MSLNFDLIPPLTIELAALEGLKISFPQVFGHFILADKQNCHNILCLSLGLIAVSSSELPAFEQCKTRWLSGERSLPIGLLVAT